MWLPAGPGIMIAMTNPALNKIVLVTDPRATDSGADAVPVRRFRLARLPRDTGSPEPNSAGQSKQI